MKLKTYLQIFYKNVLIQRIAHDALGEIWP